MSLFKQIWRVLLLPTLLVFLGGSLGCSERAAGPRTWIDYPRDGSSVPTGKAVAVQAHAFAPEGVNEVILAVNGQAYRRGSPAQPGESFSQASLEWMPMQEGDYVLQVTAYTTNGEVSTPATVRVRAIGTGTLTPTSVPAPVMSITPPSGGTITPVPGAPDLEIMGVEALYAGMKGSTAICNTRVTYRNIGTAAVPRDFTIQFHFNGTPQIANTVAGGLGPGVADQITFVYQFEGSPYIGINLDSTNVIAESNETNNAFAEAVLCSGPTPVVPATDTPTPTRIPTVVIQPPPVTGCSGTPNIASFGASPASIQRGQSATLSWGAVTNADNVSIEPGIGGVPAPGSRSVSPNDTTTYTLVARCGNNSVTRKTTIQVTAPPPPRDTTAPSVPKPQDPTGGKAVTCSGGTGSVTLKWSSVSDPSGVTYYAKWSGAGQSGGWEGSGTQHGISIKCGYQYSWQVRACDGAGNCSNWSSSATFTTGTLH
jgi:hypothetical protein